MSGELMQVQNVGAPITLFRIQSPSLRWLVVAAAAVNRFVQAINQLKNPNFAKSWMVGCANERQADARRWSKTRPKQSGHKKRDHHSAYGQFAFMLFQIHRSVTQQLL
jgi:hypothetical protein